MLSSNVAYKVINSRKASEENEKLFEMYAQLDKTHTHNTVQEQIY